MQRSNQRNQLEAINWLFTCKAVNHQFDFQRLGHQGHPKGLIRSIFPVTSTVEIVRCHGKNFGLRLEDLSPNPSSAQVSMTLIKLFNMFRPQFVHL